MNNTKILLGISLILVGVACICLGYEYFSPFILVGLAALVGAVVMVIKGLAELRREAEDTQRALEATAVHHAGDDALNRLLKKQKRNINLCRLLIVCHTGTPRPAGYPAAPQGGSFMKRLTSFILLICLFLSLTACGSGSDAPTYSGVLYADFSCGNSDADTQLIREYPFTVTATELTPAVLAGELSALTGLAFTITATPARDGWAIDWAAASTLLADSDGSPQKEDFTFHDSHSLRWFMMDSLWRTLTANLQTENIYYTMDGGKELQFDELAPIASFPAEVPYLGSAFYFAHADVKGDDENPYAPTLGLWKSDTTTIEMDGFGNFILYSANGFMEAVGYLTCEDEFDDGTLRYDMYTHDDKWLSGFYFDSPTQIHTGNYDDRVFVLEDTDIDIDTSNTFYDEQTGLLLTYPNEFSANGSFDENGIANFYTLWDTGMLYWTDPNDNGLSPAQFMAELPLNERMELEGNVVIAYGEVENADGNRIAAAYYWVVDREFVVNIMLLCSDMEEAAYWYGQFQNRAFYVEAAGSAYN